MISTFDERAPFKKRLVSASLTEDQRAEFDRIKDAIGAASDGVPLLRGLWLIFPVLSSWTIRG